MPACPRSDIVSLGEVGVYHCWSRCVRRAFLCGQDAVTGIDYGYRREWIRAFEERLAGLFGIEVGFHAELSNHIHLVVRTRPDVVDTWSDQEVVRRWLVILNQIRAGEAFTPETSTHTSACDRIRSRLRRRTTSIASPAEVLESGELPDGWLCELTIDETPSINAPVARCAAPSRRASDKGMLPITLDDYLELLDASGRILRDDKPGAIPPNLAPILRRLGIRTSLWSELVENYHDWFGHFVGAPANLARRAHQVGRRWFRGQSKCAAAFG